MATTGEADRCNEAREAMAREGVPAPVIEYVLALRPRNWIYQLSVWSYVAVMIAGFGVGAVLWVICERFIEAEARASAPAVDGLLFDTNFGIGFLILLFAWILISGLGVSALFMRWPRARATLFVSTLLDRKNRIVLTLGNALRRLSDITDPDEYVSAASRVTDKRVGSIGALLAAAGLIVLIWEFNAFTLYSPHGFIAKPVFPWEAVRRNEWRDAEFVELGCNHVVGKHASDDIIYDVNFAKGSSRRLSAATPLNGDLIGALETIDNTLRAAGVRFERWNWLRRDPLHRDCLAVQKTRYSEEDYARLERILRIGEFANDP